jgi:hypothetical protein
MSKYFSLSGQVAFNHVTVPDRFEGKGAPTYKLTINLDEDSLKVAEKREVTVKPYKDLMQVSASRLVEFGEPEVYNSDRELVGREHLSLFNDKVTILVSQGKKGTVYLEKIRVEEKATPQDYDPSDF